MAQKQRRRQAKNRSGKGSLIKGMSRRLPSELLGDPLFRGRLKEIMRGYAGIYVLYHNDKPYYTGLTSNLFRRVKRHQNDRHAGRWDQFVIFRIAKVKYVKDIETLLHALIETKGNRVRGKVPRDADINRMLRAVVSHEKKRLKTFERALR